MFDRFDRMFSKNETGPEEEPEDRIEWQSEEQLESDAPSHFDDVAPDEGEDDGPNPGELDVRITELEADVESTQASVRSIRNSQDEITQAVEEMNDTVRRLVGVYDRYMAEENPFVDVDSVRRTDVGETADEDTDARTPDGTEDEFGGAGDGSNETETPSGDTVVSFDDLRWNGTDTAGQSGADDPDRDGINSAPSADANLCRAGSIRCESGSPPTRSPEDDRAPVLGSIPDGYAGDVLVMEWLTTLMEQSGPAGAMRAVKHYQDVGWISPAIGDRLVDVLGGPSLDVFVDPMQPREPTAEDHARSHEYLRVLDRLSDI